MIDYASRFVFCPDYAHRARCVTPEDHKLILFNCYKTDYDDNRIEKFQLDEVLNRNRLNSWINATRCLHRYVENKCKQSINHMNFFECSRQTYYSNVFQVFIHVLRGETFLKETHYFKPIDEFRNIILNKSMKHIYLLFGDDKGK